MTDELNNMQGQIEVQSNPQTPVTPQENIPIQPVSPVLSQPPMTPVTEEVIQPEPQLLPQSPQQMQPPVSPTIEESVQPNIVKEVEEKKKNKLLPIIIAIILTAILFGILGYFLGKNSDSIKLLKNSSTQQENGDGNYGVEVVE